MGVLCVILLAGTGGCVTTDSPSARMHEREDYLILRDNITRLEGRMESMEMEYRRLLNEIEALRANPQQNAMQARIDGLEKQLSALDAARERDRQAVIEQLSGRITEVMRTSGTSAPRGGRTGGATSTTGYEHEVQAGETLSAIAAAYQTTMRAIIEANDLQNPDHLRQGQKLFIPK